MSRLDIDSLRNWIRYSFEDDEVKLNVKTMRLLLTELDLARRVIGYASLSKAYLMSDDYYDIVRELEVYESLYDDY
jgi:hypothetical protein